MPKLKICCISDTHMLHNRIQNMPDADILIHAGDFCSVGEEKEVRKFNTWLGTLKGKYKDIIVIAGNHDKIFESNPEKAEAILTNCTYLMDDSVEVNGFKIYGSPWQPWFFGWAFNVPRMLMHKKWEKIPDDTDILITHGPAAGYGGITSRGEEAGCEALLQKIKEIKPILHVAGHIHEGYGMYQNEDTTFVNASTCTLKYKPYNDPVIIEVEK